MSYDIFLQALQTPRNDNLLNKNLWFRLQSADNNTSIDLFIVHTFTPDESALLQKALFDAAASFAINEYGDITASSDDSSLSYVNFLVKTPRNATTDAVIKDINSFVNKNIIVAPGKKWILAADSDKIYKLLFNPIHSAQFKTVFDTQVAASNQSEMLIDKVLGSMILPYCKVMDGNPRALYKQNYADQTCNCIIKDNCIDNATNSHFSSVELRNLIGEKCVCRAPLCSVNGSSPQSYYDKTSFMNSYKDKFISNRSISDPSFCAVNTNICNLDVSAAGSAFLTSNWFNFNCNNTGNTGGNNNTTPQPTTTAANTNTATEIYILIGTVIVAVVGAIVYYLVANSKETET